MSFSRLRNAFLSMVCIRLWLNSKYLKLVKSLKVNWVSSVNSLPLRSSLDNSRNPKKLHRPFPACCRTDPSGGASPLLGKWTVRSRSDYSNWASASAAMESTRTRHPSLFPTRCRSRSAGRRFGMIRVIRRREEQRNFCSDQLTSPIWRGYEEYPSVQLRRNSSGRLLDRGICGDSARRLNRAHRSWCRPGRGTGEQ